MESWNIGWKYWAYIAETVTFKTLYIGYILNNMTVAIPFWIQTFFSHIKECCFYLSALSTRKVQSLLTLEMNRIEFNLYFAILRCEKQLTCYPGDWKLTDSNITLKQLGTLIEAISFGLFLHLNKSPAI